jgi:hypothetical protein
MPKANVSEVDAEGFVGSGEVGFGCRPPKCRRRGRAPHSGRPATANSLRLGGRAGRVRASFAFRRPAPVRLGLGCPPRRVSRVLRYRTYAAPSDHYVRTG